MKKVRHTIRMRDFDFARVMRGTHGDDITEWFSDNDVILSDILGDENIEISRRMNASNGKGDR